jgi:hypothetical protein
MNWQTLINPFSRFTEKHLLFFGLISTVIGSYLAAFFGVTFDGIIDIHLYPGMTFLQSIKENLISILLVTLLLFGLGKFINPKTRLIDIVNSSLLFRVPFYISAGLVSIPLLKRIQEELMKNPNAMMGMDLKPFDIIVILLISVILIITLIYAIALLFNGFKTATNLKSTKHKILFAITIVVAEVLSKIILTTF